MKGAAIILFGAATWSLASAIRDVFFGGVPRPEPAERFVGFVIGSFLIPLVFLLVGLWSWFHAGGAPADDAGADGEPHDDA